jgi:uncharacterized protein
MRLFLAIYLSLYSLLHLYVFFRVKAALGFGLRPGLLVGLFFLLMIFAPVIVRLSENAGHEIFARCMAYTGYFWMAILFLFFSVSILIDIYRLVIWLLGMIQSRDISGLAITPMTAFIIPLTIALSVAVYGYFEALNIRTEHITVETTKLPANIERFRIAQISDVHIGLIVRGDRLERMLQKIREADPDILVSTGDLLDGQINGTSELAGLFSNVKTRSGKYAVTGNHEYIAGIKSAMEFTKNAGFKMLRGESINVDNIVTLVGVDDSGSSASGENIITYEKSLLSPLPRDRFTVLLKHRPLVQPQSVGLFDLQLSGHTHKGQLFPFSIITHFYYAHQAGLLNFDGGTLYISRGTGTWGPPIRFLSPPEVTVIDIVRKK